MSTPRPTRSRVSSPYVGAPPVQTNESQNANGGQSDRPRTFMDKWVEPPLPAPRPSFAEAGIERHGVVQNMAPLGTRPSSKMMRQVTARLEMDGLARSNTKRATASTATTPGESTMTPEPFATPLPVQAGRSETPEVPSAAKGSEEVASPASHSRSSVPPPSNGQGVVAARKSTPVPMPIAATSSTETPLPPNTVSRAPSASQVALSPRTTPAPHAQTPTHYSATVQQSPYAPANTPTPSTLTPLVVPPLPMDEDGLPSINIDLTDKIVESAVQEAVDQSKWPTAYALRTLYDDHRKNKRIVRLIEAVYNGRATDRDYQEFNIIMRKKKREGKKGRTGEYYFNGDGSDPAPATQIFSSAIAVANPPVQPYKTPYSAVPPRPSTANSATTDPQAGTPSLTAASMPASPRKESDQADQHVDKRPRTNSALPSLKLNGNAEASAARTKLSQSPGASGTIKSTPRRSNSMASSTSSLSSVDEKLLGEGVLSAGVSPARPVSSRLPLPPGSIGLGFLVDNAVKPYQGSPYASANNFAAVASQASVGAGSNLAGALGSATGSGSGTGFGTGFGAGPSEGVGVRGRGVSVAEKLTLVHNKNNKKKNKRQQQQTPALPTGQASSGPKQPPLGIFSIPTPAAPATPSSSASTLTSRSTGNLNSSAKEHNNTAASRAATHMAPSSLLSQESQESEDLAAVSQAPAKAVKGSKAQAPILAIPENDEVRKRKREARDTSNKYAGREESFVRTSLRGTPAMQQPDSASDCDGSVAPPPKKKRANIKLNVNSKATATVQKTYRTRNHQEEEPDSSPTALGFKPDFAPGSVNTSRAGTPLQAARQTRKKPAGSGLRLKLSPKKKNGTSAGMPKENPQSPIGMGANGNQEEYENNEYCSACSGDGDLVCCDGCIRSFHIKCVDPPMEDGSLPEEWFCNKCQAKQEYKYSWRRYHTKVFDQMQSWLSETNPSAFQLPEDIREYFTDVKTGPDGEYEEVQPPPPPRMTKKNAEELNIDYFRKKDAKGNAVLCHSCHLSASAPDRMIVPCSFCGLNWHLDCLPVPLAKEPNPLRQWRCPAHVDDLLATLPQFMGPAHRFRTIKGAPVEIPAISRGFRNTGHIEIANDDTDVEDEPGFFETRAFGKTFKLPEKGIVLDFISKVKQQGGGYLPERFGARADYAETLKNRADAWQSVTDSLSSTWNKSDLYKKQAALNLAALATSTNEPAVGNVDMLIETLLNEAPPAAVALMGRGDAPNMAASGKLSDEERISLQVMRDRIDSLLSADSQNKEKVATDKTASDPVTIPDDADIIMTTTEGVESAVPTAEKPVEAEAEPEIEL